MSQVIQFTRARAARMPDSKPALEDGYTRIVNPVLERLAQMNLTAMEFRVVQVIERKTFGYNKSKDWIAQSQIAEAMSSEHQTITEKKVSPVLLSLIAKRVILRDGPSSQSPIKINTRVSEWQWKVKATKTPRNSKSANNYGENHRNTGDKNHRNSGATKDKRQTTNTSSSETSSRPDENLNLNPPVETQPEDSPPPKKKTKPSAPVKKPNAAIQTPNGKQWGELVDLKLAEGMARAIDRLLGATAPANRNLVGWANTIRLMREQDSRDPKEIRDVFVWANKDSFWSANILSPAKLREKFDQLKLKRKQESEGGRDETGRRGNASGDSELDRQLTDLEYARDNF